MAIEVRSLQVGEDLTQFLDVPQRVYQGDPNWVPPLRSAVAKELQLGNPFFQYGKLQAFVAFTDGNPVGRIVAAINQRLIEREGMPIGIFGYFESLPDIAIAEALFAAAQSWLQGQGIERIRGPINLLTNNQCAFLVDGFDSPPALMMPYNPPFYPEFAEKLGFKKAKDAYAYDFPVVNHHLSKQFKKGYQIACKSGVTFRPIHTKGEGFESDVRKIFNLFNISFAPNWSSTPRTFEEFHEEAKSLQALVDPDLFPIAEFNGDMIGFWMGLPDYNIALKHVGGKLDLWGTLKFLWYRRQINQGRVITLCSLPEFRRKMVPLGLIYLGMQGGQKKGKPYQRAELSHVWEDNTPSRKLIEASGGKIYKTYRVYEKAI
jgi:hypothetical protein